MKLSSFLMAAAAATTISAGAASALTFGTIPGGSASNEALAPLGLANPLEGWYGANIWLQGAGTFDVTATLMGAEAGYENSFTMVGTGGGTLTDPAGDSAFSPTGYGSLTVSGLTAGLLDFSFSTSGGGGDSVANGSNPDNTTPVKNPGINFFTSVASDATAEKGTTLWLFFDDDGASNDDNHDDLVVKLEISSDGTLSVVPVPAAGFLLIGGLGGLAALRRRKKKAS